MRITESMRYESILQDISRAQQRVIKAQHQVATGKKVNKPSDDPVLASDILRINGEKSEGNQYSQNLTFAKSKLQFTDNLLDSVEKMVERARTLGQLSFSDPQQALGYLTEVEGLRDQIISAADSAYSGRYIFGGSVTTQPPYVKNPDNSVTYNGNTQDMPIQVSRTATVQTQIAGSDLFSGSVNIFDVMADLATAIQNGDQDGIDAQLRNLEKFAETVSLTRSKIGGYLNLLANVDSDLVATRLAHETELANKEAADMAAAITELTVSQNGLEATLTVGAHISQLSILNYLR
jgi:flagellar hook-associated protein 3 FlgL